MRSVLLIANRHAGHATGRDAQVVVNRLASRGVRGVLETTGDPGEVAAHVAKDAWDAVVAIGGDGTLRSVVDASRDRQLPVGIIPRGTANVVARELGIPRRPAAAADLLIDGSPRRLDLGQMEGRGTFLAMVGIGFDACVVRGVQPGRWKAARMTMSGVSNLLRPRLPRLEISVDGRPGVDPAYGLIAANTRNYGGWFCACPDAQPDDGRLEILSLHKKSRTSVLSLLAHITSRRRLPPSLGTYQPGQRIVAKSLDGIESPVQADGDPCGTTPVSLWIEPSAIAIISQRVGQQI